MQFNKNNHKCIIILNTNNNLQLFNLDQEQLIQVALKLKIKKKLIFTHLQYPKTYTSVSIHQSFRIRCSI